MSSLGTLICTFVRSATTDTGDTEITFCVSRESRWLMPELIKSIKKLAAGGKDKLTLTVKQYRRQRSNDQNRLMWALLEIMAQEQNGGRTGGVTAWDCYLDMIDKYGSKFEYLQCTAEAFSTLKAIFRAIKIVEERDHNGTKTVMCKAYVGSSEYNTQEMTMLIDGIFDELAKMGVDADKDVRYLWEEWSKRKA